MANPILNQIFGNQNNKYIQEINKFANQIKGQGINPQNEMQKMLNNGNITQEQYNQAYSMAKNIAQKFFGYKGK